PPTSVTSGGEHFGHQFDTQSNLSLQFTASQVCASFEANCALHLTPRDLKLVELINRFNLGMIFFVVQMVVPLLLRHAFLLFSPFSLVYDLNKPPLTVMSELLRLDPSSFEVTTRAVD